MGDRGGDCDFDIDDDEEEEEERNVVQSIINIFPDYDQLA